MDQNLGNKCVFVVGKVGGFNNNKCMVFFVKGRVEFICIFGGFLEAASDRVKQYYNISNSQ